MGVAICDRDIGGCGNMLSARAACGSGAAAERQKAATSNLVEVQTQG